MYPRQTEPGYYGPKQYGVNAQALWSFILGLAGAVPASLILGFIALGLTKDTGQSGRWLAVSGIVLSTLWTAVGVLAVIY